MPTLVVSALSTFDNKGLKKGKKEVSAFEKQVKTFGKTFAAVFSARALFNYGKNAVKAFAADEKAAKSLEIQLKNTGFAFSAPSVEYFIANLQKTTGVLDDELRPAFQKLLTVTGSITKSQDALQTALDVSAAGYGSVVDVSQALAKGFAGQTTALGKLIPSLDKATLKSGDMNKIMRELNNEFAGQSAARLTTYAGKMDLLKVASENVKEEIGKGIVDALDVLSKDTSIQDTAIKMENLGKTIADVITGVGVLIAELQKIPGVKQAQGFLFDISVFGALARLGKMEAKPAELPFNKQRSAGRISAQVFRTEVRQQKELDRLRALEIAKLKAKTEVDKLKDKFDLERIGLTAALNAATDEETKLRIKAQLAILDNNEALAKKYNAELEGAKALDLLKTSALAAGNALLNYQDAFSRPGVAGSFTSTAQSSGAGAFTSMPSMPITNAASIPQSFTDDIFRRNPQTGELRITVDTANTGDRFQQLIAESIQAATKNGISTSTAGSL